MLHNADPGHEGVETPSPSGSGEDVPSASITAGPQRTSTGTLTLDIGGPVAATLAVPVTCTWSDSRSATSFRLVPTQTSLYGEPVTVAFVGGLADYQTLVLERQGQARYYDPYDVLGSQMPGHLLNTNLNLLLDTSQAAALPFEGMAAGDELVGQVFVDCGWAPAGLPAPSLDPSGPLSRGTATLVLDTPASAAVSLPLDCQWSSKTRVVYYTFPGTIDLFGEQASLYLGDHGPTSSPLLSIYRWELAEYTGSGATYQTEGYGTGRGSITFHGLTPDPESYPWGNPLPSPIDPFIRPLGDNEAARSLSGTMTWDCGAPPASVPVVEPSYVPEPAGTPIARPRAVLTIKGRAGSWSGEARCGQNWIGPDGNPIGGLVQCGGPQWGVPDEVVEVKAGSTLVFTVAGFKLAPGDMTAAPADRVEYYRGGEPDVVVTIDPIASKQPSLSYLAPAPGDWVLVVPISGAAADGSTFSASYLFHVRVAE